MAGVSARILNRSVVAFDAPEWRPPTIVLLDTNVAAEALLKDAREHAACAALLQRLGEERTTVVFNRLLEIELWETVFNADLRQRHPRRQLRHVRYTNVARRRAASALEDAERLWERTTGELDWVRVELHEVADAVPDLMRAYGLQSYDAVHAATLLATGITDFVTRDTGFARLLPEDATLHTTAARLTTTRAHRSTASPR